jgi:5'-nucleotidase / UDP-sugar diphosphatase
LFLTCPFLSPFPWIETVKPALSSALRKLRWAKRIRRYTIKWFSDFDRVAICAITTKISTEQSSSPDAGTTFGEEVQATKDCVAEVQRFGVNKIILLSHIGYSGDLAKLATIPGVDVIIGGHSHSLLGDNTNLSRFGFSGIGPYATIVGTTCVVQAWEYNKVVGNLDVDFDGNGNVRSCNGTLVFPLNGTRFTRVNPLPTFELGAADVAVVRDHLMNSGLFSDIAPDVNVANALKPFRDQLVTIQNEQIAVAAENLCHSRGGGAGDANCPGKTIRTAVGGGVCHLVAQSFLYNVQYADVAIQNAGGCRASITSGPFTYGNAFTILPFSNTLVTLVMTGDQIRRVLEDSVFFFLNAGGGGGAYPFGAGLRWHLDYTSPPGSRFSDIQVNKRLTDTWKPIDLTASYTVVTNNFIATPRDGYTAFGEIDKSDATKYVDTYKVYAQSLVDYAQFLGTLRDPPASEYSTIRLKIVNGTVYNLGLEISSAPVVTPSNPPSRIPTKMPTKMPTKNPTKMPTKMPTKNPSKSPTKLPSKQPTLTPATPAPTSKPVAAPCKRNLSFCGRGSVCCSGNCRVGFCFFL